MADVPPPTLPPIHDPALLPSHPPKAPPAIVPSPKVHGSTSVPSAMPTVEPTPDPTAPPMPCERSSVPAFVVPMTLSASMPDISALTPIIPLRATYLMPRPAVPTAPSILPVLPLASHAPALPTVISVLPLTVPKSVRLRATREPSAPIAASPEAIMRSYHAVCSALFCVRLSGSASAAPAEAPLSDTPAMRLAALIMVSAACCMRVAAVVGCVPVILLKRDESVFPTRGMRPSRPPI